MEQGSNANQNVPSDRWGPDGRKQYAEFEMFGVIKGEPQVRELPSGHYVARAYISYRKNKKNRDTGQWEAEYHGWDCEFWGDIGKKFVGVVVAGDALVVRGRMKVDRWEDKATGEKRNKTVLDVLEFEIVSHEADRMNRGKQFREKRDAAQQRLEQKQETDGYPVDGDIPF